MQNRALPVVAIPVAASYLIVVVVWSTTPLFLHLSTLAFPAALAGGLRMAAAALVASALVWLTGGTLRRDRTALLTYAAMTPGVFGAMYLSYLAAAYVPTGLISVFFGLSPIISAVCARLLATDPLPAPGRMLAALLALAGLICITAASESGQTHVDSVGVALLLAAVLLFSLSGVLVRKLGGGLDALAQTAGALWVSLPFYLAAWLCDGTPLPEVRSPLFTQSLLAIGYLALFGSVLGFVCYYQVLKQMPAASASLITVITPVFALALGALFNDERLTANMLAGALLVIVGVAGFLLPLSVLPARLHKRLAGAGGARATAGD